ncbi:FliH/SctL family protein [Proteiniborus sp. MB09-C3]|uniref:FliH/SctL family protein n=1 Tax=Proteiniborus sp. MB09-C3 TaxID=3050072 RepID=UPI002555753F|nr:FliH/SctL family protein [Proteiniborus sp. MB09-C3]WIV10857.1 FliH/SctL family protein [Proteiniborus sp. MB09-C3]
MSNIIKSSQVRIVSPPVHKNCEQENREAELADKIAEAELTANIIIEDARIEAENLVLNARKDAEKVLEDTHLHAKNICDAAKEDGYKEGFEKGYNEGKKVSDELIEEANEIKKSYLREREIVLSNIEKDVINMTMSLCEKIIHKKLIDDEETIISIVLKGIDSLNVKENLLIKVSKEDYDVVEMSKQRILAMANLVEDIQVRIDSTLSRGGCIIEGSKGNVDVSVDMQIEEMKKLLTTLLNSE